MRKQLLAGTALAAATMLVAGGAVAADKKMMKPSISVNGYYDALVSGTLEEEQKRGGDDMTPDTAAVDVWSDAEIHFNGRGTTDNGLKVHVRVELEGAQHHSTSDPIDEYFLSVAGSFGKIIIGGTGGAPVKMLTGLSGSWATGVGETLSFDVNDRIPNAGVSPDGIQGARSLRNAALAAGHRRRAEGHLHFAEIRRLPARRDLLAEPRAMLITTHGTTRRTARTTALRAAVSLHRQVRRCRLSASVPA